MVLSADGGATSGTFTVSFVDDASIALVDRCIADVVSLYVDVVADRVTFGNIFKGFRLRPRGHLHFVPADLLQRLGEHPFIAFVRPSRQFSLPHWTHKIDSIASAASGGNGSGTGNANRNWGLDRIDQSHLPLDNVRPLSALALPSQPAFVCNLVCVVSFPFEL
jgi:hypothetical protein